MIKVVVQIEAGSCERWLFNEKTLEPKGKFLMRLPFPYPYGFVLGTSAADGDCVDCYIITKDKLMGGSIVDCEPVGLLEQDEDGEVDHKVLAALPGGDVVMDQKLLDELRSFIYELVSPYPDSHIQIGRILPQEVALKHLKEYQDK
jgi:inorganic pyrophosphatase